MNELPVDRVRDLIQRFFNGHDPNLAAEFFTPDLHWHGGSVGSVEGSSNYADVMRQFFAALPDVHATEQDVVAEGDKVAMRFVVEGAHLGTLWGVPATGNPVRWDALMIYRFVDGKVAEQWAVEDWTAILQRVIGFRPPWSNGFTTSS